MRPWVSALIGSARVALGAVFLFVAVAKITQFEVLPIGPANGPSVFAYVIERNGLIPANWSMSVAISVIAAEVLLGVWLLSHRRAALAGLCAAAVLAAFSIYLVLAMRHQGAATCNCFGTLQPIDVRWAIARNIGLILVALFVRLTPAAGHTRESGGRVLSGTDV